MAGIPGNSGAFVPRSGKETSFIETHAYQAGAPGRLSGLCGILHYCALEVMQLPGFFDGTDR